MVFKDPCVVVEWALQYNRGIPSYRKIVVRVNGVNFALVPSDYEIITSYDGTWMRYNFKKIIGTFGNHLGAVGLGPRSLIMYASTTCDLAVVGLDQFDGEKNVKLLNNLRQLTQPQNSIPAFA